MKTLALLLAATGLATPSLALAQSELMAKSGCAACHRVDDKLIGPSFKDVASRYRADPKAADALFDKVRDGGSGTWGETPMPPNDEERISDADLKTLIAWVLRQ